MLDIVQLELLQIFTLGQAASLDAERKIAQDKKNQKARLITLARDSRNSILRRFRAARETVTAEHTHAARAAKRKHTNVRALALQRNPSCVSLDPRSSGDTWAQIRIDHLR